MAAKKPKSVAALKNHPEPLHPARHSLLWRQSKMLKTWEQRWYALHREGFVYAKSPQGMALSKGVFNSRVQEAWPEDKVVNKDGGTMMWGFTVRSEEGSTVTLYTEEKQLRDAWVRTINGYARSIVTPHYLGDTYNVDYDNPLGTGLFAVVLRAEDKATKMHVAIKIIKADAYREYRDLVEREIMVWHAVGVHPHIVKLKEVLYSEHRIYFVAELCEGGNLMSSLAASSSYCERDVARIMRQLVDAVRHVHAQGISHSDLKPENIVLVNKSPESPIKLIDFSLASFFHTCTEPGGTPEFVAPELLVHPEFYAEKGCGPAIDVWALGIILYFLLCGKTPFYADSMEQIIEAVKAGTWSFTPQHVWQNVSLEARDLVMRLLQYNPQSRPSAASVLEHPWLRMHPSQYRTLPLTDAMKEFRALFGNEGSSLRTSWIRRSGVIRHSNHGQATLAAAAAPGQDFMGSGAAAMTAAGAGMNGALSASGMSVGGPLGGNMQQQLGAGLGMGMGGEGMGMGSMGSGGPLMFGAGPQQPQQQLLMSPAAVASIQNGRGGGGGTSSDTFSLNLLLQQQQQMAAAALAAGAPAALQHVNAPHSPRLPASASRGQLSAEVAGGVQSAAGSGLPGIAAPPSSPLPGGSTGTSGSTTGGVYAPPPSPFLSSGTSPLAVPGAVVHPDHSSLSGFHRAQSGLLSSGEAGTSSSSAAAVTRERKLAQLAALQAQLSALQIRQQHRVEVAAAAAAAAHMQPTQGAAVARHLMGISPLDADIDERPSDSRFLRRRSSASGTRPPPVRRNSALLEHTWTSGAGGSPGMGGVMPAGGSGAGSASGSHAQLPAVGSASSQLLQTSHVVNDALMVLGHGQASGSHRGSLQGHASLGAAHMGDDLHGKAMISRMGSSYLCDEHPRSPTGGHTTFGSTASGSMGLHQHTLGNMGMLVMSPPATGMHVPAMAGSALGIGVPSPAAGMWRAG